MNVMCGYARLVLSLLPAAAHKNFLVHVRGGGMMIVSMFYHDQSHYHLLVRFQVRRAALRASDLPFTRLTRASHTRFLSIGSAHAQGGTDFYTVDKQQLSNSFWKRVLGIECVI